jgi:hypothetical protein
MSRVVKGSSGDVTWPGVKCSPHSVCRLCVLTVRFIAWVWRAGMVIAEKGKSSVSLRSVSYEL